MQRALLVPVIFCGLGSHFAPLLAQEASVPPESSPPTSPPTPAEAPADPPSGPPTASGQPEPSAEQMQRLQEAVQSLNSGRVGEAMIAIDALDQELPGHFSIINLRGAAYVRAREYAKAKACFAKALEMQPTAYEPRFNMLEMEFVTKNFAVAGTGFQKIVDETPTLPEAMRHLLLYKIMICRLMKDQNADVEDILKEFTFKDDTPAYYMSRAARHLIRKEDEEATEWLITAQRIYRIDEIEIYLDSLKELDLVPSIEGGGIDIGSLKPLPESTPLPPATETTPPVEP